MSTAYGNRPIVSDGLVLCLDAANARSYSGTGTTWFDLSGNNRHYTFDTGISWNSGGYFVFTGGTMTGPASNSFGFNNNVEHTIFAFAKINTENSNNFFKWWATPNTGTDPRAIQTHFPYSGGTFYYDVAGCCGSTQRIFLATADDYFNTNTGMAVWRTRTDTLPHREFFNNTTSVLNSGSNSTATVTWDRTDAATIGGGWNGNLHTFIVYNRGLTDEEIAQNFNAMRGRYGI